MVSQNKKRNSFLTFYSNQFMVSQNGKRKLLFDIFIRIYYSAQTLLQGQIKKRQTALGSIWNHTKEF